MTRILALDLSTTACGFTHACDDQYMIGYQHVYSGDFGKRLQYIEQEVKAVIDRFDIQAVVVERPVYVSRGRGSKGILAFYKQAKVIGIVHLIALKKGLQFLEVDPKSVKLALTGTGNADKDQMIRAAESQFTHVKTGEHWADSIGVWLAGWNALKLEALTR